MNSEIHTEFSYGVHTGNQDQRGFFNCYFICLMRNVVFFIFLTFDSLGLLYQYLKLHGLINSPYVAFMII